MLGHRYQLPVICQSGPDLTRELRLAGSAAGDPAVALPSGAGAGRSSTAIACASETPPEARWKLGKPSDLPGRNVAFLNLGRRHRASGVEMVQQIVDEAGRVRAALALG